MILQDARSYVARAFDDAALQFVWLSLKDTAGRIAQNCVHAIAEGWREERMKRELLALSDHLLKDIGLSRSEIGKLPRCLRSCPAELWLTDVATRERAKHSSKRIGPSAQASRGGDQQQRVRGAGRQAVGV
jgi:uncharacterized protein YjiS (DUF1127 family)